MIVVYTSPGCASCRKVKQWLKDRNLKYIEKNIFSTLLNENEIPPMNLLLLADPSQKIVEGYLNRGDCYIAESDNQVIGVYILLPTSPETVEVANIAVVEKHHGKGIGKMLVINAIQTAKKKGYKKCGFRITGIDIDFFIRCYQEEIFENGIQCRDMIRLTQYL